MSLGNIALVLVVLVFGAYALAIIAGAIATWPFGIIGLIGLGVGGFFLAAVTKQRLSDKEDRYYSDNIKE